MAEAAALELGVGHSVGLRTLAGQEVFGDVFAVDRKTSLLVLKEPGSHGGVSNLRVIRASYIDKIIHSEAPSSPVDSKLPAVDMEKCKLREEKALRTAEADAARVGVGVTREAQAICDALNKTMAAKWQGKTIVVMDEVFIDAPYGVDNCRAGPDHKGALQRVKKVLQALREVTAGQR